MKPYNPKTLKPLNPCTLRLLLLGLPPVLVLACAVSTLLHAQSAAATVEAAAAAIAEVSVALLPPP